MLALPHLLTSVDTQITNSMTFRNSSPWDMNALMIMKVYLRIKQSMDFTLVSASCPKVLIVARIQRKNAHGLEQLEDRMKQSADTQNKFFIIFESFIYISFMWIVCSSFVCHSCFCNIRVYVRSVIVERMIILKYNNDEQKTENMLMLITL